MLSACKKQIIHKLLQGGKREIVFVHPPKCAGTYVKSILNDLGIESLGHKQAPGGSKDIIYFTVIREPVARFESFLNFRLAEAEPRSDWPSHLAHVYSRDGVSLNEIVDQMSDAEVLDFRPYRTLTYYSENVSIFLVVDELHEFLSMFGYSYDPSNYERKNVSRKVRGSFNEKNRKRIAKLYKKDWILYRFWTMNDEVRQNPIKKLLYTIQGYMG